MIQKVTDIIADYFLCQYFVISYSSFVASQMRSFDLA